PPLHWRLCRSPLRCGQSLQQCLRGHRCQRVVTRMNRSYRLGEAPARCAAGKALSDIPAPFFDVVSHWRLVERENTFLRAISQFARVGTKLEGRLVPGLVVGPVGIEL